jgi:hypothetical protein
VKKLTVRCVLSCGLEWLCEQQTDSLVEISWNETYTTDETNQVRDEVGRKQTVRGDDVDGERGWMK